MSKQKKLPDIKFVTPFGIAKYPKISKPDTEGQYADGKFKTYIEFSDSDHQDVVKALKDAAIQFHGKENGADATLPVKEFKDKDTKEITGVGIQLKSKYRPAVFDSKKQKLPESAGIGAGSEIRVASAIFPWSKEVKFKGQTSTEYGVSLRLGDIQVRSLVEGTSFGTGNAFDELEDGFEYDGAGAGGEDTSDFDDL